MSQPLATHEPGVQDERASEIAPETAAVGAAVET